MSAYEVGDIRYNARAGAFEAGVDIVKDGTTYRYPCSVGGPMTMEPAQVTAALARHGARQSGVGADLMSSI